MIPDWSRAACKGMDRELFFPPGHGGRGPAAEARAVCARCPIRRACAEDAIGVVWLVGIWGGMTTRERMEERSRRAKAAA